MAQYTQEQLNQAKISANLDYTVARFAKHAAARGLNLQTPDQVAQGLLIGRQLVAEGHCPALRKSAGERAPLILDKDDEAGMVKIASFIEALSGAELAQ